MATWTVHKMKLGSSYTEAVCGRRGVGTSVVTANSRVTCGRCLMLMKFAQTRAAVAIAEQRAATKMAKMRRAP